MHVEGGESLEPPVFADAAEARAWLARQVNFEQMRPGQVRERGFKLDRMRALIAALGHPESDVRFMHVAGSKGKGSTVEMLASCLGACGFAVGVFTSPHLVDVSERIRVGGRPIDDESLRDVLQVVARASAKVAERHGAATYFEVLTGAALLYFAREAVDLAVLEVGLGGRLDSTNVITPEVCAITSIQLEHTQVLGETLEEIAREKAGIIKPGVTTITVPQADEVMKVLRDVAAERDAPLLVLGETVEFSQRFEASPELGPHVRVCVSTPRSSYEHLAVPLMGHHQGENCGLALAILDKLRERGFEAPEKDVAAGLAMTPPMGRLERVWQSPAIFVDGAHTPESVEALIKSLAAHLRYDSLIVVFGCAGDKKAGDMLGKIAGGADKVIFTRSSENPRAADPEELHTVFEERFGKMSQVAPCVKDAINMAHQAAGRGDLILVTGSFYVAGEAKRLLMEAVRR